jgi:tetratricopeptide (TPR) repeat protein
MPSQKSSSHHNGQSAFLISALIFLLTCLLYYRTLHYGFVNFDDNVYVTQNPHVLEGLSVKNAIWAFLTFHADFWHPLTWLSLQLDATIFGTGPAGFHFTNFLIHAFNSALLFHILHKMSGKIWQSCFVALIFSCHPLHVESVAWISERKDVLSGFFWMTTIAAYMKYTEKKSLFSYGVVLFFFFLGLMSKPMIVTLPCALLLLDYWPLKRADSFFSKPALDIFVEKIPLFILTGIASIFAVMVKKQGTSIESLQAYPLCERIAHSFISYCTYISKLFWPSNLTVYYPYEKPFSFIYISLSIIFISAITLIAVMASRKAPYFFVGWFWFIGTLVPVIGIVKFSAFGVADRFMYIPMIGILIIIAWGMPHVLIRFGRRNSALSVGSLAAVLLLFCVSWHQIGFWENSITLFEHCLKHTKNNFLIHNNLGNSFAERGEFDEAVHHYNEALKIRQGYSPAHHNLGNLYYSLKKYGQAIENYNLAAQTDPNNFIAYHNLGGIYLERGEISKSKAMYVKTLEINSSYVPARRNLRLLLSKENEVRRAINDMKQVLQTDFNDCSNIHSLTEKKLALQNLIRTFIKRFNISTDECRIEFFHTEQFAELRTSYVSRLHDLLNLIDRCENPFELSYHIACIHAIRGESDAASKWLQRAIVGDFTFGELVGKDGGHHNCFGF